MEHFNKSNLKESDLMPSGFRSNNRDKTKTYKPLKARFLFEQMSESAKKTEELNDIKMTTTIRPQLTTSISRKKK